MRHCFVARLTFRSFTISIQIRPKTLALNQHHGRPSNKFLKSYSSTTSVAETAELCHNGRRLGVHRRKNLCTISRPIALILTTTGHRHTSLDLRITIPSTYLRHRPHHPKIPKPLRPISPIGLDNELYSRPDIVGSGADRAHFQGIRLTSFPPWQTNRRGYREKIKFDER